MGSEVKTERFAELAGGGVATTAAVAAALGTPTAVVTRVGEDARFHRSWKRLGELGIGTGACEFRKDSSTALTVCAAFGGDRMMITYDPINRRLNDLLRRSKVRRVLRAARHVHFACAFRDPPRWFASLDELRRRGISLSADIGWNPEVLKLKTLPHLLRRLDFFFPNEAEARTITGDSSPLPALRTLARWVRYPVVKLGRMGSIALVDGNVLRVPVIPVRVVDATGAGDAFNAGFLHSYLRKCPWLDCLAVGNICGGIATTAPGGAGVLPKPADLKKLLGVLLGSSRKADQRFPYLYKE